MKNNKLINDNNEENRKRTINYIIKNIKDPLKRIPHECSINDCCPVNINKIIKFSEEISKYEYDTDIFVCKRLKVHVCDDSCLGDTVDSDGFMICTKTERKKQIYLDEKEINFPKDTSERAMTQVQTINQLLSHKATTKQLGNNIILDNYYNIDYPTENETKITKNDVPKKIDPKIMKIRNRNPREYIDHDITKKTIRNNEWIKNICKIFLNKIYIGKLSYILNIYLHSFKLYSFINSLNENYGAGIGTFRVYDILINSNTENKNKETRNEKEPIINPINTIKKTILTEYKKPLKKIEKRQKEKRQKDTYFDVIKIAEDILEKVLPGTYRIKMNFDRMKIVQEILYTRAVKYVDDCRNKKIIVNMFELMNKLNFDKEWGKLHELTNWVTNDLWLYYLNIILNTYKIFEHCGECEGTHSRKCLDPENHIISVLYILKEGFEIKTLDNGSVITTTLIPKDFYLNQPGVLLEPNKLSTFLKSGARRIHGKGKEILQDYLLSVSNKITPFELRNRIFNECDKIKDFLQ